MKIADLAAAGADHDGVARYYSSRGGYSITGWTGQVEGLDGWWWALATKPDAVVVAMGWTRGWRSIDRDADIARAVLRTSQPEGLAS